MAARVKLVPKHRPTSDPAAEIHWRDVITMFDATYPHTVDGFCFQDRELVDLAKKLDAPRIVAMIIARELTVEDLEEWQAWTDREAFCVVARDEQARDDARKEG